MFLLHGGAGDPYILTWLCGRPSAQHQEGDDTSSVPSKVIISWTWLLSLLASKTKEWTQVQEGLVFFNQWVTTGKHTFLKPQTARIFYYSYLMSFIVSDLHNRIIVTILMSVSTSLMTLSNSVWSIWLLYFIFCTKRRTLEMSFVLATISQYKWKKGSLWGDWRGAEAKISTIHKPKASEGLSFPVEILRPQAEDGDEEGTHVRLRRKTALASKCNCWLRHREPLVKEKAQCHAAPGSSEEFRQDTLTRFSRTMNTNDFCWSELIKISF